MISCEILKGAKNRRGRMEGASSVPTSMTLPTRLPITCEKPLPSRVSPIRLPLGSWFNPRKLLWYPTSGSSQRRATPLRLHPQLLSPDVSRLNRPHTLVHPSRRHLQSFTLVADHSSFNTLSGLVSQARRQTATNRKLAFSVPGLFGHAI
jgi:hypothetical protein